MYEQGEGVGKGDRSKSLTLLCLCFPIYKVEKHYLPSKSCHDTKIINIYYRLKTGPGTKFMLNKY